MIAVSAPQIARPVGVVGDARRHQQPADIGVAEAQRAVVVGELRRSPCDGNCAISTEISSTMVHSRHGMLEGVDVEAASSSRRGTASGSARRDCRPCRRGTCIPSTDWRRGSRPTAGQVCQSLMVVWNCMPGSARGPGGVADLLPQLARLQRLARPCRSCGQVRSQSPSVLDRAQEVVGDAHRVVRVLAGDGEIGFGIPVGVVGRRSRCPCSPAWRTG